MARTYTVEIPLGYEAPNFELPDVISGKEMSYTDLHGKNGTIVMFICNHCPFVVHVREELVKLANDYLPKGIGFIAINSNDIVNYPDDSPDNMRTMAKGLNFPFPYLFDKTQEVAKAYDAVCTPDFSVFDGENKCVYRGQLDDSRPGNNEPVNGKDLRKVCDHLLLGKKIDFEVRPSLGCNIKWKV